jgi:opacity protein-like surface antigen
MPAQVTPAQPKYALNVTVTYNATLSNVITGSHFWMQGGSVQIHGQLWRGWGVAADIAGAQAGNVNASGVALDMVTATFGPRYTWSPAHQRYALFGQALAGIANGFNSVFPAPTGAISSNNSLALVLGGGMNVALSRHVAVRALDADWLRTQLPNGTTNVQNNLRLGAGFVFRFR